MYVKRNLLLDVWGAVNSNATPGCFPAVKTPSRRISVDRTRLSSVFVGRSDSQDPESEHEILAGGMVVKVHREKVRYFTDTVHNVIPVRVEHAAGIGGTLSAHQVAQKSQRKGTFVLFIVFDKPFELVDGIGRQHFVLGHEPADADKIKQAVVIIKTVTADPGKLAPDIIRHIDEPSVPEKEYSEA